MFFLFFFFFALPFIFQPDNLSGHSFWICFSPLAMVQLSLILLWFNILTRTTHRRKRFISGFNSSLQTINWKEINIELKHTVSPFLKSIVQIKINSSFPSCTEISPLLSLSLDLFFIEYVSPTVGLGLPSSISSTLISYSYAHKPTLSNNSSLRLYLQVFLVMSS